MPWSETKDYPQKERNRNDFSYFQTCSYKNKTSDFQSWVLVQSMLSWYTAWREDLICLISNEIQKIKFHSYLKIVIKKSELARNYFHYSDSKTSIDGNNWSKRRYIIRCLGAEEWFMCDFVLLFFFFSLSLVLSSVCSV